MLGKLLVNEGMFYENVVQKILVTSDANFISIPDIEEKHLNNTKIDFILSNHSKLKYKIFPAEVISNDKYTTRPLIRFNASYHQRIMVELYDSFQELKRKGGICLLYDVLLKVTGVRIYTGGR